MKSLNKKGMELQTLIGLIIAAIIIISIIIYAISVSGFMNTFT